uniref:Ubiquitin-like domain-containing protein n=1 Tax=Meloidogyne floridensis TaxID=298350 RepID=A0A915NWB7_9BILA
MLEKLRGFKKLVRPNCLLSLIFTIVVFCCWESTSLSSDYLQFNSWVVQLRRRRSAVIIPIADLNTTDSTASSSTPNTPASLASGESSDQSSDVINRFFVVQAPSSTRNISPQLLSAILNHNSFSSMNSQFSGEQEQEEQTSLGSNGVNNSQNEENNGGRDINTSTNLSADSICIRIKFLDDSLKIVQTNKNVTIGNFKRLHFSEELKEGKIIRLIYQGRLLRDDSSTLEFYGLTDSCVLHCHIGTRPYSTNNNVGGNENNNRAGVNGAQNGGGGGASSTSPLGILGTRPRMVETGFWLILFNFVFSYAWNLVRIVWEWANRQEEEQEAPTGTFSTFLFHFRQRFRRFLSVFLDILVGPAFRQVEEEGGVNQQQNNNNRHPDDTLKFLLLWSFVLVYPQFTDRRSIFFLSMLTSTSGLYFYFSRSNALRQRRTSN